MRSLLISSKVLMPPSRPHSPRQSQFDYCSSLFIHLDTTHKDKLTKCFAKSIHRVLKIKIFSLILDEQYTKLLSVKILPLAFRQYFRFCTFLFGTIKNNNSILAKKIEANISSTSTRNKYAELPCKKTLKNSHLYLFH